LKIDYLTCTIDGKPMESYFTGIPTIQNTDKWIREERQKEERSELIRSVVATVRKSGYAKHFQPKVEGEK